MNYQNNALAGSIRNVALEQANGLSAIASGKLVAAHGIWGDMDCVENAIKRMHEVVHALQEKVSGISIPTPIPPETDGCNEAMARSRLGQRMDESAREIHKLANWLERICSNMEV